jgi:transcriptional regulator with XRE-family HTH domain
MVVRREATYARSMSTRVHAGPLLRQWRTRRRLSQLDLSARTGVSTRHLSCVETGRSKPSRDLLLFLADELEIPRRATNELLLAAGFAPVFTQLGLDAEEMAEAREVVRLVLDGNGSNPTTVIDTRWNLIDANAAAFWFTSGVADHLLEWPINVARLSLHPDGLAPRIANLDEFAAQLLRHMHHTLAATHDDGLAAVIDECEALMPQPSRPAGNQDDSVVLPLRIRIDDHDLAFMSTITTFGAARDITLSELSIETLYPADDATREVLADRPWLSGITAPAS